MRWILLGFLLLSGCRRAHKPAVEPVAEEAPPVAAEPAPEPIEPTHEFVPIAPSLPTGKAPTADDVRAKMAPLYPEIGRCLANVEVPKETGWVVLRFVILPTTGRVSAVQIAGAPAAQPCAAEVLRQFVVEPFAGDVVAAALPMSKTGVPMRESELPDSGVVK